MSKHTPLPWKFQPGFNNIFALDGGDSGLTQFICKCEPQQLPGGFNEAEANAKFIHRACNSHYDLLEALETIVSDDAWQFIPADSEAAMHLRGFLNEQQTLARKAIAKAKGEA